MTEIDSKQPYATGWWPDVEPNLRNASFIVDKRQLFYYVVHAKHGWHLSRADNLRLNMGELFKQILIDANKAINII